MWGCKSRQKVKPIGFNVKPPAYAEHFRLKEFKVKKQLRPSRYAVGKKVECAEKYYCPRCREKFISPFNGNEYPGAGFTEIRSDCPECDLHRYLEWITDTITIWDPADAPCKECGRDK